MVGLSRSPVTVWAEALSVVVCRGLPKDSGRRAGVITSNGIQRWPGYEELMTIRPVTSAGREVLPLEDDFLIMMMTMPS